MEDLCLCAAVGDGGETASIIEAVDKEEGFTALKGCSIEDVIAAQDLN